MKTSIYDKTIKGREEIATRKYQLAPRLRTLLVLVDGHRPEEELLRNVAGLGLTIDAMRDLLEQGYIVLATSYASMAELLPEPAAAAITLPAPAEPSIAATGPSQAQLFRALYEFYNKTIKANIGLRGFTLQLKVEKAGTIDELLELRSAYLEAVQKAKGSDTAAALSRQLDQLLGGAPAGAQ